MKAISLHQPYASGVANLAKGNETRHWHLPASLWKRRVAIHAALRFTTLSRGIFDEIMGDCYESRMLFESHLEQVYDVLPFGAIVCTVVFTGCSPVAGLQVGTRERRWGNYDPGRYAWHMAEVVRLDKPVPCKGHQSVFQVDLPAEAMAQHTPAQIAQMGLEPSQLF